MLYYAKELTDVFYIPANLEETQPCHRVRRKNINYDYEARDDPVEDPKLKFKIGFFFFAMDQAIKALRDLSMPPRRNKTKFQQLMEFERGWVISLREGARNRSSYAAEQFHSDASLEAVDRRAPNNSKNWH
ncbi:hypothetical protein TNCV_4132061 [Trichonephila clavipes]|nr:hypothetical protein TNCV_4132061 [Trichonephila clavipes]